MIWLLTSWEMARDQSCIVQKTESMPDDFAVLKAQLVFNSPVETLFAVSSLGLICFVPYLH